MNARFSTSIIMTILIGTLLLSACGSTAKPLEVGAEENGTQVELQVGQQLVVSLESNPTTGFSWHVAEIDESLIRQVGEAAFEQGASGEGLVGAPGVETLTFEAIAPGTTTLVLGYDRPWESIPPEQTFLLTIVIR